MSHIESRLFHYFVVVAEEQHFTRAAERLGITPRRSRIRSKSLKVSSA
jgi:Bacterial regulatory helix-turn-helix protein, lysR family